MASKVGKLSSNYVEIGPVETIPMIRQLGTLKAEVLSRFPEPIGKSEKCPTGACPVPTDGTGKHYVYYKTGGRLARTKVLRELDKVLGSLAELGTKCASVTTAESMVKLKRGGKKK